MDSFKGGLASVGIGRRPATGSSTHDSGVLDPALWSGLPVEVLHVVFSHLPLPQIPQLRVLSKAWDHFITGETPGFSKVCAKVNPKVFGMLCGGYDCEEGGFMAVRAYDTDSNKWHRFRIFRYNMDSMEDFIHTMWAGDGGLVCIVSTHATPCSITVFNPLTRKYRELPSLPRDVGLVKPGMVQLAMDRKSKCYKVIVSVVGASAKRWGTGRGASIYSSETGKWSNPMAYQDLIFGCDNDWDIRKGTCWEYDWSYLSPDRQGPCVYDCANGTLIELDDRSSPCKGLARHHFALVKDRLFVLREEMDLDSSRQVTPLNRFCITEQRAQMRQPYWVQVRDHSCKDVQDDLGVNFEAVPRVEYHMHLYACKGFLLVTASNGESGAFKHELAWLYDMSTYLGKWLAISPIPKEDTGDDGAMFELHWDAVP